MWEEVVGDLLERLVGSISVTSEKSTKTVSQLCTVVLVTCVCVCVCV
jgi:hypothetical protein